MIHFDDMVMDIMAIKRFKPWTNYYLLDPENWVYLLYLSHDLVFLFQKKLY